MNWFLDMCILIFYANPSENLSAKTRKFVNSMGSDILAVCFYITDKNLPKWIERQRVSLKEIRRFYDNSSYHIGSSEESKILFREDIIEAKKIAILSLNKTENKEKAYELLKRNQEFLINNLNYFIKKFVDKKVIPIENIDFELKSSLFTYLTPNDSDANTVASGIQYHQQEKATLLTGDTTDWTKELLENAVVYHTILNKKYPDLPEIKYMKDL